MPFLQVTSTSFLLKSLVERQGERAKIQVELLPRMGRFRARVTGGVGADGASVCYLRRRQGCLATIFIYWWIRSVNYLFATDDLLNTDTWNGPTLRSSYYKLYMLESPNTFRTYGINYFWRWSSEKGWPALVIFTSHSSNVFGSSFANLSNVVCLPKAISATSCYQSRIKTQTSAPDIDSDIPGHWPSSL